MSSGHVATIEPMAETEGATSFSVTADNANVAVFGHVYADERWYRNGAIYVPRSQLRELIEALQKAAGGT